MTVTTATDQHRDVIGRAIAAGKHVFTEKILAPTVAEAEELVDLAREAGVALVVSLPRLSDDYTVAIERILDEGTLGDLTYSRVRLAHDGWVAGWLPERFADPEAAIGGALTDLGCHPAYLTRLFHRAEPLTISATLRERDGTRRRGQRGRHGRVPRRPNRRLRGQRRHDARRVHHRAAGHPSPRVMFGFGGERLLAKGGAFGEEWQELPLPEARPGAFAQWVQHIHDGTTADDNLRHAVELTRMVVAANESAAAGRAVDRSPRRPSPDPLPSSRARAPSSTSQGALQHVHCPRPPSASASSEPAASPAHTSPATCATPRPSPSPPSPTRSAKSAERRAGDTGAAIYADYPTMLAEADIDAVDICLPHHLHKDAIVAAARAGKHILCEKPLCLTPEEAAEVDAAVTEAGVTLMCAHNQLFLPAVAKAKELIESGALGRALRGADHRQLLQRLRPGEHGMARARLPPAAAASSSTPATTPPTCCCTWPAARPSR